MRKNVPRQYLRLVTLFFLMFFITSPLFAKQKKATVTRVVPTVNVIYAQDASRLKKTLKKNNTLDVGDNVITEKRASVDITFSQGNMLRLAENSSFIIKEAHLKSKTSRVSIELTGGKLFGILRRKSKKYYKIRTRTAVVGVKGTDLLVSADGDATDVYVKEAKGAPVDVYNPEFPDQKVDVPGGMKTRVEKGKSPTLPIAMTAAELAMFAYVADLASLGGTSTAVADAGTAQGMDATTTATTPAEPQMTDTGTQGMDASTTATSSESQAATVVSGGSTAGEVALTTFGIAAGGAGLVYGTDALVKSLDFDIQETHTYSVSGSDSDLEDRYDIDFNDYSGFTKYKKYFDKAHINWIKYEITGNSGQGGTATFYLSEFQRSTTTFNAADVVSFSGGEVTGEVTLTNLSKDQINNLLRQKKLSAYVRGNGTGINLKIKVTYNIQIKFKLL